MSTLANSPLLFALTGTPLFMARVVSSIFFIVCLVQI
jgi:hypothetical protein